MIWDGSKYPEITSFILTDIITGEWYNFRYKVFNKNGESPYSDILMTWACELPTAPSQPQWVTSTETEIYITWEAPNDDGGCPVLEYKVFMDDGNDGDVNNIVNYDELQGIYYARSLTVTDFPTDSIGKRFRFIVKVYTDYTDSNGIESLSSDSIILADLPD